MPELTDIVFSPTDTTAELAAKLSRLTAQMRERVRVGEFRVGDTTKLDHNGDAEFADVTLTGLTMATGAVATYVLTCDADGVTSWAAAGVTGAAGSDGHVQYNDAGAFGASAALDFNDVSNTLTTVNYSGTDATLTGTVQAEHLYSTDDAVIDDDFTVGGEFKGARECFGAGNNATAINATAYLRCHGITMSADRGWVMARAGSIVTVAGQFQVVSSTGGTAKLAIYDGASLVASAGTVTCDDEVGNYVETQAAVARGFQTFAVKKVYSAKLTITGTCQISSPAIVMDVQYDT